MFGSIKTFALAHRAIAAIIAVAVLASGYGIYKHYSSGSAALKYVLSAATKGTLVSSVTGTGQVAAENQVDITSEVSGTVNAVYVHAGDEVKNGQIIALIDERDAQSALKNAQLALENAKVAYQKAIKLAGDQSATSTSSDVAKANQDGYNAIANTSIDLPSIFTGVSDIIYNPIHSGYFSDTQIVNRTDSTALGYKNQAGMLFDAAKQEYDANFAAFKNLTSNSSQADISALLNTTNSILKKLLAALTGTYNTIDYINDRITGTIPPEIAIDKSTLSGYVNEVNSDTTSVTNALNSIDNSQDSGTSADLNMKSAELAVSQNQTSLDDAQTALANHRIKAPFNGIIAKVASKVGDKANSGTNVATIVTREQMVNISLNEIDAAKVSKGEKATLTFDAIEDLTLAGHVTNVDIVGTVSQGVVSYTVEIAFDSIDARVKPGMTVNANIITAAKPDALMIPSTAVKTSAGTSYVQYFDQTFDAATAALGVSFPSAPLNKAVTVGLSNDVSTEILSGLAEGDQVVTRTITSTTKTATAPSILGSLGGNRGGAAGGNAVRTISR